MQDNWKKILLKSGIPLEASVRNIIKELKIGEPLEYNFLRKNVDGLLNNFSIDMKVDKNIKLEVPNRYSYNIEYLIECKYCTPETNWIFMSHSNAFTDEITSLCVDLGDNIYQVNDDYYYKVIKNIPIVGKGVSLKDKNPDSTQIREAYNQLSFAYISRYFENLMWRDPDIYFMVPIVVTTANLWRLKENISIEEVEQSKNIEDICDLCNILRLQSDPNRLMRNYFMDKYANLDKHIKVRMQEHYYEKFKWNFEEELDAQAMFYPNTFFIINYNSLKKELKKLNKQLSNPKIIEVRENAK